MTKKKKGRSTYDNVPTEVRAAWKARKAELAKPLVEPLPQLVFARDGGVDGRMRKDERIVSAVAPLEDIPAPHPLYVYEPSDLNELTVDEVREVWERRQELCGSLEAAAEVLALLRVASGTDEHYRGWRAYLAHPLIRELEDELPPLAPKDLSVKEDVLAAAWEDLPVGEPQNDFLVDRRDVSACNVRLRKGQSRFREEVLAFHGGCCCVTGCREAVLLEAAHVAPYRGEHTNDVRNGLALRVDIHRLFDRHLISIDPHDFVVRVSPTLEDRFYRSLDGLRVLRASNAPHRELLGQHHDVFIQGIQNIVSQR